MDIFGGLPGINPADLTNMDNELRRDLFCATPMYMPGRSHEERAQELLKVLPKIDEKRLEALGESSGSCSICLQPFLSLLSEEEHANAMDSPAHAAQELGVSQLDKAYHLVKWIKEMKDTCPMCRGNIFDPDAKEDKPKMLVFGGTPRLIEFYRKLGIEAEIPENDGSRARTSLSGFGSMFS